MKKKLDRTKGSGYPYAKRKYTLKQRAEAWTDKNTHYIEGDTDYYQIKAYIAGYRAGKRDEKDYLYTFKCHFCNAEGFGTKVMKKRGANDGG